MQTGDIAAGGQQPWRAFEKHQAYRRIDQFERTVRASRSVGGAMGVAIAHRPRLTMAIEQGAKARLAQAVAVAHQGIPARRQCQIGHRFTRQTEGKVEAAQPRAGALQHGLEGGEIGQRLDLLDAQAARAIEHAMRDGDGLGAAWCRGEIQT